MRLVSLVLLAACGADQAMDPASMVGVDNAQLIGSPPLTPVVPHLVRGASHETQVVVEWPSSTVGATVRMAISTNPGGSPAACPSALTQCLDLALPAFRWNTATITLEDGEEVAIGQGVVPLAVAADQVEVQAVVDIPALFVTSLAVPRNVYDRDEVCELEIISPDGSGAYIAYTDLNVGNPYMEGLIAWSIPTASLTVYVPSGENLILRNYDTGDLTEVVNHDAGGATIYSGSTFETSIAVSCP